MADALVRTGRVARITTTGRHTGRPWAAAVSFVDEPDGSMLVAATDAAADWALNLLEQPGCAVETGTRRFEAIAEPLSGPHHARAVRELILRHGTPSEGLGRGPSFRLRPVDTGMEPT